MLQTCSVLEGLSKKDGNTPTTITGKLKGAFRKLCGHSGAGLTLTQLVPTDSYGSVLCGGLKVIFNAMQSSDFYRKEVYRALEDLPGVLNDHAAMIDLNQKDRTMHERAASLYAAVFRLMEVIFAWFLQRSLVTGAKILVNSSRYSDKLTDRLAEIKTAAQNFSRHAAVISARNGKRVIQQNHTLMFMQGRSMQMQSHHSEQVLGSMERMHADILTRLAILDQITPILQEHQQAGMFLVSQTASFMANNYQCKNVSARISSPGRVGDFSWADPAISMPWMSTRSWQTSATMRNLSQGTATSFSKHPKGPTGSSTVAASASSKPSHASRHG